MTESKEQILARMEEIMPFSYSEKIRPYILEAMQIYANQQLSLHSVTTTLPNIDSNTFKNWLESEGYAETLNPLVYKKNSFEYDKERLHKHFINMIEFGN